MFEGSCLCGKVHWIFRGQPEAATACNCTACRRYGALWIYGYENEEISVSGATNAYARGSESLSFHFCPGCGSVAYWRANSLDPHGRRRMAVNVRLAEPDAVASLPVEHFDGLVTFDDLGRDGRNVKDLWF